MLLYVGLEPLEPGGLAEGTDLLLLQVGSLLQDVVEAEVGEISCRGWSLVHDESHRQESPAV